MICSSIFDLVNPILKYILPSTNNFEVCFPDWFLLVIEFYKSGHITIQELGNTISFLVSNNLFKIS